jgi:integrase
MKLTLTAVLRKDKVNSNNQHPIIIRISYANQKSRVGLGYSLEVNKWESSSETPNKKCEERVKREITNKIEAEKKRIEDTFGDYYQKEGEYPTHPVLLKLLKENRGRRSNTTTFNQQIIREYTDFIRGKKLNIATYKAYRSTLVKLEEFLKDYKLGSYKELNDKFHNSFITKLEKEHYRAGTIGKYTKNIKAFLNYLAKEDKVKPAQYKDFKINKEYQTKPSLELGDIALMRYAIGLEKHTQFDKLKIPELTQEEKNILIVFLWLCETGQSFIDYQSITGNDILLDNGGLTITYNRIKLNKPREVIVVLTPELLDLLILYYQQFDYSNKLFNQVADKKVSVKNSTNKVALSKLANIEEKMYQLSLGKVIVLAKKFVGLQNKINHYPYLLPQFTNQAYNRAIKRVAEKIGLTQQVSVSVKWGGRLDKPRLDRKCDLISSHLCRKWFIQSNREQGVSYEEIMKRTGISSMNTLLIYNKITKETLIRNAINKPNLKASKELIDDLAFNIAISKSNKKNSAPSRHSQIKKK